MTYQTYYLTTTSNDQRATTLNTASAKLVTLTPGLRPERPFAPLARGPAGIFFIFWFKMVSADATRFLKQKFMLQKIKIHIEYKLPHFQMNVWPECEHRVFSLNLFIFSIDHTR